MVESEKALVNHIYASIVNQSFDFQFIIFDHRVAQKLVRRFVQRFAAAALSVPGARSISMIFADVDGR